MVYISFSMAIERLVGNRVRHGQRAAVVAGHIVAEEK